MEDNHIPIDRISGTSMGALIGGLYASGIPVDELSNILTRRREVFALQTPYDDISFRRREGRRDLPQALSLDLEGGVGLRNSALSDSSLNGLLTASFGNYLDSSLDYDDLPIPFRCVATDLDDLMPVIFSSGSLATSVRASLSIPGVFAPVNYGGHTLVDGAIVDNLPTDVARKDLESDIVIGVHLSTPPLRSGETASIAGVFTRAYEAGTAQTERRAMGDADILLVADTEKFSASDNNKGDDLIAVGYAAAERARGRLIQFKLSDNDWADYLANRSSRKVSRSSRITGIEIVGGSTGARQVVQHATANLVGQAVDVGVIDQDLRDVQADGTYHATFETLSARLAPATQPQHDESQAEELLVRLTPNERAKTVLLLGVDVAAENSNVTRASLDLRLIDHDLGGFQSELRTDVRVGYLTRVGTEYYRKLSNSSYFLQPRLDLLRSPVYLWAEQRRISERFEQTAGGGLDAGRQFGRDIKVAAEWRMQSVRWSLRTGQDQSHDYSGVVQKGLVLFSFDDAIASTVASRGTRIALTTGALLDLTAGQAYPILLLRTSETFGPSEGRIFALGSEVETYFRQDARDALRFTLGGPLRLSASSLDEYRGTDTALLRGACLQRFAKLPQGLGQGIYATFAYEAGDVWSPEKRSFLRQDGIAGIVAATTFGVVTVSGSVGDAGRRKIFFSLGRLF